MNSLSKDSSDLLSGFGGIRYGFFQILDSDITFDSFDKPFVIFELTDSWSVFHLLLKTLHDEIPTLRADLDVGIECGLGFQDRVCQANNSRTVLFTGSEGGPSIDELV